MRIFFYDTETSDMPDFGAPSNSPHQPHIVQIAAALVDDGEFSQPPRIISEINLLVRPDGWASSPETIAIHGITNERAEAEGINEAHALGVAYAMWRAADYRVGHVESFDARIMRIAMKRFGYSDEIADTWKAARAQCTGKMTKTAVRPEGIKSPKLGEAYRHFFNEDLPGAHDARVDMHACMRLFFAVMGGAVRHAY